jgi:hypothetical protein
MAVSSTPAPHDEWRTNNFDLIRLFAALQVLTIHCIGNLHWTGSTSMREYYRNRCLRMLVERPFLARKRYGARLATCPANRLTWRPAT